MEELHLKLRIMPTGGTTSAYIAVLIHPLTMKTFAKQKHFIKLVEKSVALSAFLLKFPENCFKFFSEDQGVDNYNNESN